MNPIVAIRFDEGPDGNVVSFTARGPGGESVNPRIEQSGSTE